MAIELNIEFTFSVSAQKMLPPSFASLNFQTGALLQQSLAHGDNIRFSDIANCPWFVVTKRYWDAAAERTTLTIWLDVPED